MEEPVHTMTEDSVQLNRALELVKSADCILISAGAGMSVPAGNDYYDKVAFAERFPGMLTHGYSYPYQLVGNREMYANKALTWGYLADFIHKIRFNLPLSEVYTKLGEFVKTKDSWVITTNVDGLFERHGFDSDRIFTPQGDFKYLQCSKPCEKDSVFESKPIIETLLPHIDRNTQLLKNVDQMAPKCPRCGAGLSPNVNGGKWYTRHRYDAAAKRLNMWLSEAIEAKKKVCVLEFGVGFNTPGVLRWPMENLAYHNEGVSIVRVNLEDAELPEEIPPERGVSLALDVTSVVNALYELTKEESGSEQS
jgi:NAD-dependent SIR2 family protein deacetylase